MLREIWVFHTVWVGALLVVFTAACAGRIPPPGGAPADAPHVGWVIMSGDADNPDRDFVCQSTPRGECVVPVDRPDARVQTDVHFYYHTPSTETRFTGSIRIGFFDKPYDVKPDFTVKPGESPATQSVSNFVSAKPGTYATSIAVVATSTQTGQTQNIRDQVTVIVR